MSFNKMEFPENILMVKDGDISHDVWDFEKSFIHRNNEVINLDLLQSCMIVSDRHESYQTGLGRLAGGILGATILGPIGAAGGLLAGGKRRIDETIIICTLLDGRSFTAECSQLTAAKLSQISSINEHRRELTIKKQNENHLNFNAQDTIECPMCAEIIKRKAKICRFCGHKITIEKNIILENLLSNNDIENVFPYLEQYKKYTNNINYSGFFSESQGRDILRKFIEKHEHYPEKHYREIVDIIKDELQLEYKAPLLDFFREGFKFARSEKKFRLINDRDVIVIYKSNWTET